MKTKTAKILIFIILAVCAALTVYVLMYREAISLFNENKEIHLRILQASAKDKEMESVLRNIKATFGDYEKIQNIFIAQEAVVDFIQDLEFLGKEIGASVKIESVTNRELNPALKDKEEILISLTARGGREKVATFLKLLEYLPYKISIRNAIIQQIGASSDTETQGSKKIAGNQWQATVNIAVIKLK